MTKAVRLAPDGTLTQVEVPELLVARRSGLSWAALKQAESTTFTPGNIVTATVTFHRGGWYLVNGNAMNQPAGSFITPPIFPATLTVRGPWS